MAPVSHVLRFALNHDESSSVLVAVSNSKDASSEPLNLELLATDDQKAYVMTLSHDRIARYKHCNSSCADSDWEDALKALLLPDQPIGDVEASARIADDEDRPTGDDGSYLFIDVRRRVSGDAGLLGTLKLRKSHKAEATVDVFDWCVESVKVRDKLEGDAVELRRELESLKTLVAEETAKIQELARSKQEFEATHDSWLRDLLNEKKVKIRMQEQILATAHVDPDKLASAATASKLRHSGIGASDKGKLKRKAQGSDDVDAGQRSDDEADEMDLDVDQQATGSHDEGVDEVVDMATTDSETASDPDSNPEPKNAARNNKGSRASPASAAGSSGKADKAAHNLRDKKIVTPDESEGEAIPHKNSLRQKNKSVPAYAPADDESTASE